MKRISYSKKAYNHQKYCQKTRNLNNYNHFRGIKSYYFTGLGYKHSR